MTDIFDVVNLCDQVVGSSERDSHKFNLSIELFIFWFSDRMED